MRTRSQETYSPFTASRPAVPPANVAAPGWSACSRPDRVGTPADEGTETQMLNYEMFEVARLEQRLREREFARASHNAQRPVQRHAARSGLRGKRLRLVAVAGLVGAAALL